MKNLISFITLLIFVNTITNYMIGTEARLDPVLDTDGNKLLASTPYFIRPVNRGMGGGLAGAQTKGICVFAVAQRESDSEPGEPAVFLPDGYKEGSVVHESTDMNIAFLINFGCRSGIWKVDGYDESTKQNFVMLGGSVGKPGNETVSNWFKIEKHTSGHYKIVFCPSVCDLCAVPCSDVGVYVHKGVRRLALRETPFEVEFQKVRFDHKY